MPVSSKPVAQSGFLHSIYLTSLNVLITKQTGFNQVKSFLVNSRKMKKKIVCMKNTSVTEKTTTSGIKFC